MSQRHDQEELVTKLREAGTSRPDIVAALRLQHGLNARQAWRVINGWTQREVAELWSRTWPDDIKDAKRISSWETWPHGSGHVPPLDQLDKLASLYRCSVADLVADFGDHRPPAQNEPARVVASAAEAPDGWYCEQFHAFVRVHPEPAEVVERRTVVAVTNDLREVSTGVSVPRHAADRLSSHRVEAELVYGGILAASTQLSESRFQHVIRPATPLSAGDRHEYELRLRVPQGQLLSPHYVYAPKCRCDAFRLIVKFDPARPPAAVYMLEATPTASIYEEYPSGERVEPDVAGEVRVHFRNLRIGYGYGIRWTDS
ncbi:helix-turn-helix domain-containing protein [Lentzea sp. NPDC004789]